MTRKRALLRLALSSMLVLPLAGCGLIDALANPSFEPVAAVIKTAAPAAYVASASMLAVSGEPVDGYWLNSVGQVARASFDDARFYQLVHRDVLIAPECTRNPIEGDGYMLDVGIDDAQRLIPTIEAAGQVVFGFEPECDGKLRIQFGMGTFMVRSFQKVRL